MAGKQAKATRIYAAASLRLASQGTKHKRGKEMENGQGMKLWQGILVLILTPVALYIFVYVLAGLWSVGSNG